MKQIILRVKVIIKVILANIYPAALNRVGQIGKATARYCYAVWMRHLINAHKGGMTEIPKRVAEFGPGSSLGVGLCALLSGANEYYALDYVKYADTENNLCIFDELVEMFKARERVPDNIEYPTANPSLEDYSFPAYILTDDVLSKSLDENRLKRIRNCITHTHTHTHTHGGSAGDVTHGAEKIEYVAPWDDSSVDLHGVELILSQDVLEHVDLLKELYAFMSKVLTDEGYMSHVIDFKSHDNAIKWNGHWGYSERLWTFIRGKRSYLINRLPLSAHIKLCEDNNFDILSVVRNTRNDGLARKQLKYPFTEMTDDDFITSGVYILCKKHE